MKAIILAGGLGSRLAEETSARPKPMVEIGGRPILWHIMKIYSHYGINDFIVCLGYKGYMIKEFFANYFLHSADVTIDLQQNKIETRSADCEPWRVTLIDTGAATMTGGRLKRALAYVEKDETFCFTYGDGLADINIDDLLRFHRSRNTLVTLTATQSVGKFGALEIGDTADVTSFSEKPKGDGRWVSGGFFVLSPKVAPYIQGDSTIWERDPLETLSRERQVSAYKHHGFWQPMDTLHDRKFLEDLWDTGSAPWKIW
ncbi:MAG: glucose-1-phosphate cytidylyltransferase [Acidobacteriaceae bacterium]